MRKLASLTKPAAPWLHVMAVPVPDAWDALRGLEQTPSKEVAVRFLRGRKCRTAAGFFDEAAAALQFPPTFGENWDAFYDCLCDLSWLKGETLTICITDAGMLLDQAPRDQAKKFLTAMEQAAANRNKPGRGKTARPFHVVLQTADAEEATVNQRWLGLGATPERLETGAQGGDA